MTNEPDPLREIVTHVSAAIAVIERNWSRETRETLNIENYNLLVSVRDQLTALLVSPQEQMQEHDTATRVDAGRPRSENGQDLPQWKGGAS